MTFLSSLAGAAILGLCFVAGAATAEGSWLDDEITACREDRGMDARGMNDRSDRSRPGRQGQ